MSTNKKMLQQLFNFKKSKISFNVIFSNIYVMKQILCYFKLPPDRNLNSMIFYNFMSRDSPTIQDFQLMSTENYHLSNFTFKEIIFSH